MAQEERDRQVVGRELTMSRAMVEAIADEMREAFVAEIHEKVIETARDHLREKYQPTSTRDRTRRWRTNAISTDRSRRSPRIVPCSGRLQRSV